MACRPDLTCRNVRENEGMAIQTLDEALVALKRGEPIHLSGADALVLADRLRSADRGCSHRMTPDRWEDGVPLCRECGADMSAQYEMGD